MCPKSDRNATLAEVVNYTADQMGVDEFHVAEMMSHFFERLAFQVAAGKDVLIPCFGLFGVSVYESKKNGPDRPLPRPYPAFSGARPFRNEVIACCPRNTELSIPIRKHRKHNHHSTTVANGKDSQRTMTAMSQFRDRLQAERRKRGYD
jgi:hypothetical protein